MNVQKTTEIVVKSALILLEATLVRACLAIPYKQMAELVPVGIVTVSCLVCEVMYYYVHRYQ